MHLACHRSCRGPGESAHDRVHPRAGEHWLHAHWHWQVPGAYKGRSPLEKALPSCGVLLFVLAAIVVALLAWAAQVWMDKAAA